MGVSKMIQDAIKTISEQAVKVAPYDKTRGGVIRGIGDSPNTYNVQVDGVVYTNVRAVGGIVPSIDDTVTVLFPTNNTSQMIITNISSKSWIKGASDLIYPVGAYYWTSDANFNPNHSFSGEWEKIDAGITLVSAGTGYVVNTSTTSADGGEAMHVLTPNETATKDHSHTINHGHGFNNPTVDSHSHAASTDTTLNFVRTKTTNGLSLTGERAYTATSASGVHYAVTTAAGTIGSMHNTASASPSTSGGSVVSHSGSSGGQTASNGVAHNNMQPYKCAYCWHRTA